MDIINKINATKTIAELRDLLNEFEANFDNEQGKPEDVIDYSELPIFSKNKLDDTYEIFSYSDDEVMTRNGMNEWELEPRSEFE